MTTVSGADQPRRWWTFWKGEELGMSETDQTPINLTTPEMREAVRQQIVVAGSRTSWEIATALELRHALILRMLERFEAVGALRAVHRSDQVDTVTIVEDSLSARFRDLTIPLW